MVVVRVRVGVGRELERGVFEYGLDSGGTSRSRTGIVSLFDTTYLGMMVTGSIVAAAGLAQDSVVTVVASMLISPLMGPILALSFGLATLDKKTTLRALRL